MYTFSRKKYALYHLTNTYRCYLTYLIRRVKIYPYDLHLKFIMYFDV